MSKNVDELRENLLKSLGVLAKDPAEDFNESEARWVQEFRDVFTAPLSEDMLRRGYR